jgi:DNA-binding transcriptional regulator YiaG
MVTLVKEATPGAMAKRARQAQGMTQQELASMAGVSWECVDLFERGLPVPLDIRRRLLKEVWASRAR